MLYPSVAVWLAVPLSLCVSLCVCLRLCLSVCLSLFLSLSPENSDLHLSYFTQFVCCEVLECCCVCHQGQICKKKLTCAEIFILV